MSALAIIPARGGSKRIPRKNIRPFCGKPIMAYSIEVALKCGCFDEVMVSTDDMEIAEIAKKYGASVPFLRSKETSNDFTGLAEVVEEVLNSYHSIEKQFDCLCLILPTAVFLTTETLKKAFRLYVDRAANSILPVVKFSYPIQRALKIENNFLLMIWPENYPKRSQDLLPSYHDAGQFCWIKVESFLAERKFFVDKTVPYVVPDIEAQDIDTEEDWKIAEFKYKHINGIGK